MFEGIGVPIVLTGLFINEDYSMSFTAADLKRLIREELTATDKTDIERMIPNHSLDIGFVGGS